MSSQIGTSGYLSAAQSPIASRAEAARTIQRRLNDFSAAWNRHDPAQMAAIFADDGDAINPLGRWAKGRQQVQQLFADEHTAGPMRSSTHQMKITSMRWAADSVIVVDADCTMSGMRGPGGQELPTMKPHVALIMGRQRDGDWKVICARAYAFTGMPSSSAPGN